MRRVRNVAKKRDEQSPASNRPVPVEADYGLPHGRWVPARVEGMGGIKTTLDVETEEGKALLVSAGSPGTLDFDERGRCYFTLCDVALFWDTEVDEETGEISEFVRTTFYNKDGETFRTTSPYACHFIARLIDVYGMERFKAGIPVKVCERVSRREKRRYHDFKVDSDAVRGGDLPYNETA
jgi:Phage Single-stranded DNA-binding protein